MTHPGRVLAVAWSPDGTRLATGSWGKPIYIIDAASGKELARVRRAGGVSPVAWSPDGHRLATTASDNTALIVEAATGRELARVTHENDVVAVAWSPDGNRLATASRDFTARISEAATGAELARVTHKNYVLAVAWSPDGSWLATGSRDNTARVWRVLATTQDLVNAAKARAARCLTPKERAQYFLPPAPPTWCVARRLWPYHTDAWAAWLPQQRAWLADGRQGEQPTLPKAE